MDDFGSILERDYGLGRSGKGRIGSRNSGRMDSNFDSTRFSDSFGRNKFRGEFNFRGGNNLSSNWNNSGYATTAYAAYAGSYTVYDEVFSCNMQSTIPFFEDVFRVPSSRMKVSELRDNDILRGIPGSLRKSSSKVTYEDIFGELAPDEFSGPFLSSDLAGSRVTTTSSRTSSSGMQSPAYVGTPRKETVEGSKLHSESSKALPLSVQQQQRSQGSFLAMSGNLEEKGSCRNDGDWLCVGEVNLTTTPSENPPPLRLAPNRQDSGPPPSRPPPPRVNEEVEQARLVGEPSPCSSELRESVLRERNAHAEISIRDKVLDWHKHNMQAEQKEQEKERSDKVRSESQSSSRSQVLDRVRAERSAIERIAAEVEETAAEQAKLRAERAVLEHMERHARAVLMKQSDNGAMQNEGQPQAEASKAEADVKANVEPQHFTASDQETDKIKKASDIEEDSRVDGLQDRKSVEDSQKMTGASSTHDVQITTTDSSIAAGPEDKDALASDLRRDAEVDPRKEEMCTPAATSRIDTEVEPRKEEMCTPAATSRIDTEVEPRKEEMCTPPPVIEAATSDIRIDTEVELRKEEVCTPVIPAATIISESESTVSIDTISSSEESTVQTTSENDVTARGGGKEEEEEEAAPETPERLETTTHARHEKNNKSSELSPEEAIESAWEEEIKKTQQQQQQQEQQPQREQEEKQVDRERVREEARKAAERSLVARITAEVRERAALEAKARAEKAASVEKKDERRTKPRLKEENSELGAKEREDVRAGPSKGMMRVSLREQLEKERIARLEKEKKQPQNNNNNNNDALQAKLRAERSLAERITAEVRERASSARAEKAEKERLERLDKARERERERLERLEKERERERERLEKELEREREIEREKDRVSLEERAAKEREAAERKAAEEQQQQRLRMERAAVERATAEARARAERAAYERASTTTSSTTNASSRPTSVPKQRFGNSMSMPSTGTQPMENGNGNMRRATSSTNLDSDRYSSSGGSREFEHEFQEQFKGETPERRKARLERYQRTQNRAAQALAQKNKRDLELQSEQAERQRLSERLDGEIKRWSAGKDGNIRALLSTLQYVLWPESGWKQVSLTELINPAAVKKAYRRATLCVHPDKMQQKHASVQQKYIAEKVFHILQVAWNKFNSQETL